MAMVSSTSWWTTKRQAVAAARHYLSFFQGHGSRNLPCATPDLALRHVVPENRLRVYDTRAAMEGMADLGSLLYLRTGFGQRHPYRSGPRSGATHGPVGQQPACTWAVPSMPTRPTRPRVSCNCATPMACRIVSLVDTPGFMVGPETEAQAQVRHVSRLFVAAAHLRVPYFSIVLRKAYGLGAMAMTAGGFHAPQFTVAWPTGEFGAMGLEGAVRLGFRKELEAVPDGPERQALFDRLVALQYENGSAMQMATTLEIDAVIDPAHTRAWLVSGLRSARVAPSKPSSGIDTW
jgi:acetyl-CoA carboxylase carboxyltransferase component